MATLAVIPARYASTRFPGKPLAQIAGKPMVQHVYERCSAAVGIDRVIVATEDERIVSACRDYGSEVELTSPLHVSGTDRVAEVSTRHLEFDFVLNVQGDEPGIEVETISAVAHALADSTAQIATAMARLGPGESADSVNVVKVVADAGGNALYFSRLPIPYYREPDLEPVLRFRHLGIYGFRSSILSQLTLLRPSRLERAEALEQLRWLEAGYCIRLVEVDSRSAGIDTPADLEAFNATCHPQPKSMTP